MEGMILEWNTDPEFNKTNNLGSMVNLKTDADNDFTYKIKIDLRESGTKYYYRFTTLDRKARSRVGSFKTAPDSNTAEKVRFAISGDADGRMRPFPLIRNFGVNNLDFFIFNGDTIYETESRSSPAAEKPQLGKDQYYAINNSSKVIENYFRKYLENLQCVDDEGVPLSPENSLILVSPQSCQASLVPLFAAQGNYTLFDNHELGNEQYAHGGAPIEALSFRGRGADVSETNRIGPHNSSGLSINSTPGFNALLRPFIHYQPIRRGAALGSPRDAQSTPEADSERKNGGESASCEEPGDSFYFCQNWGKNLTYIQLDDRSYRDVRLLRQHEPEDDDVQFSACDDVAERDTAIGRRCLPLPVRRVAEPWAEPDRTMLGDQQLKWLKDVLIKAEFKGQIWKFIALSSPIDQAGYKSKGKSWYGGYQAERNKLLNFIAEEKIRNVVFVATDDHQTRVNGLWYDDRNKRRRSSTAFSIVAGPIGADGPDEFSNDHFFSRISDSVEKVNSELAREGAGPLGLWSLTERVRAVQRDHDHALIRGSVSDSVNFYSDDTYNYATIDIGKNGVMRVTVMGVASYPVNSFPQNWYEPRVILSFEVLPEAVPTMR
jgi:phosphodiesterase/alkaline phosphatase D-like protein